MALGKWFSRYIYDVEEEASAPAPGQPAPPTASQPAPPTASQPPSPAAGAPAGQRRVRLVPTDRPVSELLSDLPEPRFDELEPEPEPQPEPARRPPPAPGPPPPAEAALADHDDDARDPLDDGGDPPVGIPQVYKAARVGEPGHGFSLEKLAGMLQDQRLAALDATARASAIAVVLETSGVKIADIIKDAAARDQALDRFEDFLAEKAISLQVEKDQENEEIREEIRRFVERKEEEIARNEEAVRKKQVELARFRRVKRAEEQRLFSVVEHFTSENPVSVTRLGGGPKPDGPPATPAPPQAAPEVSAPTDPEPAAPGLSAYEQLAAELRGERGEDDEPPAG